MKLLPRFLKTCLDWALFVPSVPNPDERRRREILARIVLFMLLILGGELLEGILQYPLSQILSGDFLRDIWSYEESRILFSGSVIGLVGISFIWLINRHKLGRFGWLPGAALLTVITGLVSIFDTPIQIIDGRSLMLWVLPIVMAPLVLPSWAAFLAATTSSLAIALIAAQLGMIGNWYAMLALYTLAFIAWLSARALEQALNTARTEAEKNRVILENIADGVIVMDAGGQVLIANPAARNILGDDLLSAARLGRDFLEYPGRIVAFSWAVVSGVGRAAVVRDITRQVETERAKDALLGTVSHELRTPLAAISGFAEVIGLLSQDPKISEMAGRIVSNVGRLKGLVNSLLDQAQIQAGTLKLTITDVSPLKLVNEVASLMNGLVAEKRLLFDVQIDQQTPYQVRSDPERLHQVLVNLLGNAIKFTDQGTVTLRVFGISEQKWGFTVTDTGDGIPAARLPDIFKPFRRGADYATRTRQGAGLGLSITKQLVELMGGEISAQSEVGEGTTILVSLPVGGPDGK
jgi:signal transduction histidine kinase